jgi:NitT/TauT family transport system substrate-binding protein
MPSSARWRPTASPATLIVSGALAWLVLISVAHWRLNYERGARPVVRMGYMPVLTNLACPLLDAASRQTGETRFEAMKFSSFAEMGQSLRDGHIDAAFMIAPLAIVLRQQGADIKVVYIGNRHESTLVVRSDISAKDFGDLAGRTLAVPLRFSGHNLCARQLQERYGAAGERVRIIEMNPPDMPAAMATGSLDAYFVGEPFGSASVRSGRARVLYNVEQIWPGFICNLAVVRSDLIARSPDSVRRLVHGAARAGVWARDNHAAAAVAVAPFWSQTPEAVQYTLDSNSTRTVWDRYVPKVDELQAMANEMVRFGLLTQGDISGLVDDRFALSAELGAIGDLASVLQAGHGRTGGQPFNSEQR